MNTFSPGEHVASRNGGLAYIVLEVVALDMVGTTAYRVRRLKNGEPSGPGRLIGGSGLCPLLSGDPFYNKDRL